MNIKLSVSMIVKDEEILLAKCLETLKDADEIVICDTGSKDKTISIAKEYTPNVFTDYKWNDDFAEAKNHSVDKATGDWILTIDADEQLVTPISDIKKLIADNPDADAFLVKMVSKINGEHFFYPRLFRNDPGIRFKSIKHAYLDGADIKEKSDIVIEYSFSMSHRADPDRGLRMSLKSVKQNPGSSRDLYYLAREYFIRREFGKAIEKWDECISLAERKGEKADANLCIAKTYLQMANMELAKRYAFLAIESNLNFKEAAAFLSQLANNDDVLFIRKIKS